VNTNAAALRAGGCSSERRSPWRWSVTYLPCAATATPTRLYHHRIPSHSVSHTLIKLHL